MLTVKEAEKELENWGRFVHDGWLQGNLLYTPPPTSEWYIAPGGDVWDGDETPPVIDEQAGQRTENAIIEIGKAHIDSYRVLVHWYCHLSRGNVEHLSREQGIKRLSKFMHTSFMGAERMLEYAISLYILERLTDEQKKRILTAGSYARD